MKFINLDKLEKVIDNLYNKIKSNFATKTELQEGLDTKADIHEHNYLPSSGNAASATKLQTARTISLGGVLSGSSSFDGTANTSISASIAKPPKSGDWFSGGIVTVGTDGVMEVGKYIDFHDTDTSTSDYDTRLQCGSAKPVVINLPSSSGTLALTNNTLALSGGSMTGDITFPNTKGIYGLSTSGASRLMLRMTNRDIVDVGNTSSYVCLVGNAGPTFYNASNATTYNLLYSQKNLTIASSAPGTKATGDVWIQI